MRLCTLAVALALVSTGSSVLGGTSPLVFDFSSGGIPPQGSRFDEDRKIVARKSAEITATEAMLGARKIHGILLAETSTAKDGFRLALPEGDPVYGALTSLTVSLVVRVDVAERSPTFFHRLRGKRSAPGYFSFEGSRDSTGGLLQLGFRFSTENGGESVVATEPIEIPEGKWVQVAMVYTGEEVRFYCDGKRVGAPVPTLQKAIPEISADRCDLSIFGIRGGVGEVVVAPNRAFSDEQILSLYSKGLETIDETFVAN